ncbi:TraR/DksA C4-type zinc finger protein [Vibrio parahaemolyticus]|uniref:TraR/DksA family transcriptional regulator n=1 Tax=Vibrio parahaemolyticus TaxID=670 RepID=A0A8H9K0J3_VIBPH|nr:TraR/DksA C4-type zinc finger protein [Vibrio parahaemolyticus]HAS6672760.1 TraR/DksA family transcriptional regulator [Vibrio parahaemolyticus]HAS6674851.1 TraR/DksA family transcriptional regulator [Vibrio parahaemolyticus]HAS6678613.1 TraR/DksA family transcriptional regulator [Vibrio parahaemolyticus]HAS6680551.1 TraR/DksA family transcriptional regulator [Vibrio parahaemolyticus]
MTDQFDRAQELETLYRNAAISNRPVQAEEQPDEDEHGNRYCLSCGCVIPPKRVKALSTAVRCVSCQSRKER